MSIFWDSSPPSRSTPRHGIQVFTVPKAGTWFVRFLGDLVPVWVHWIPEAGRRGRSVPCLGNDCGHCPAVAQQWKAYAPALLYKTDPDSGKPAWLPIVAEVTESLAYLAGVQLRGLVAELARQGGRHNSPLTCKLLEKAVPRDLAPWFDVRPILVRMWGIRQRVLPQPTPHAEPLPAGEVPDLLPFPPPATEGPPPPRKRRRR